MTIVRLKANLIWKVFQDRKSKYWVGCCDALKISSQGKTISDLHENIEDALSTLMRDLVLRGEMDLFLKQHQWTLEGGMPAEPSKARFEIPYNIERRTQNDFQAMLDQQIA
jgi:predicted RNase H-like HicB family nuclease